MDNNALRDAAQKELLRRAAQRELERRRASAPPVPNAAEKANRELSWGETLGDVGMSALSGLQSGAEGIVGMPGDIQSLAGMGASWGAGKLGFSPEVQEGAKSLGLPQLPTSQDIGRAVESVIGPKYKPETDIGRYVGAVAEMAPSAVLGPGSLLRKGAMAVVPGVAMEATKDVTGGNPAAEAAAGVAASLLTAGRGGAGTRKAIKEAPSAAQVAKKTNDIYDSLRNAGVAYDNNAYAQFVADLQKEMKSRGYRPRQNAPNPISADLEELARAVNNPLDFSEMESLRKSIGKGLPAAASNDDIAAAAFVREKFDDFLESAPLITGGNIPADQVGVLTKRARELASRNIKNRTVEEAVERARTAGSGFENGLRIEFRKIKNNPKKFRGFSPAEKQAIMNIIGGTTPQNLLAQFGRLGISLDKLTSKASLLPTLVTGGGLSMGQFLPAAAVVGTATGAKYGSRLLAEKSAKDLAALMRTGKAKQAAAVAEDKISKRQARIRAGLSGSAALQQSAPLEIDIPGGDLPEGQNAGGRVARKSGGRAAGNPISAEVKRVRALLSEKTASMLSVPDDAIATALHIAKRT